MTPHPKAEPLHFFGVSRRTSTLLRRQPKNIKRFFAWYNNEHRHSGIEYLTPRDVHDGRADELLIAKHKVMLGAWRAHAERFVGGEPRRQALAPAVYINPPAPLSSPPSFGSEPSSPGAVH